MVVGCCFASSALISNVFGSPIFSHCPSSSRISRSSTIRILYDDQHWPGFLRGIILLLALDLVRLIIGQPDKAAFRELSFMDKVTCFCVPRSDE